MHGSPNETRLLSLVRTGGYDARRRSDAGRSAAHLENAAAARTVVAVSGS